MNKRKFFKNVLASTAHTSANTRIIQKLGINEAIVLAELFGQQHKFGKENKLKKGFFYATMDFLTTATYLSQKQVSAAIKTLEETWVYMKDIKADEEDVKEIQENSELFDEEKKEQINRLQKKAEDNFRILIDKLKNKIETIEANDSLTVEQKKEKIITLKRKVGFEKLLETKVTTTYGQKIKWFKIFTKAVDQYIKSGDGSVSMNTIRPDAFIIYNKLVANEVGPSCAIVFSDLLTSFYYTEDKNQLVEDEWFRNVVEDQAKRLGVSRNIVCKRGGYLDQLIKAGLIEKKTMRSKNATYISIVWDHLYEILGGVVIEEKEEGVLLKKVTNEAEDFTKEVLAKVKEVSGQDWAFNYNRVQFIQNRLNEGLKKDDILGMIEHMYNYWMHMAEKTGLVTRYQGQFNWTRLFGSKCKDNIEKMYKNKANSEKKARLTLLAEKIAKKVIQISDGKVKWAVYDSVLPLLETQLNMGFTEDDLINFVEGRYKHKVDNNETMRNFSWKGCFDENKKYSASKCIEAMKKEKSGHRIKFNKTNNNESRDGVKSNTYTKEEVDGFWKKAKELEDAGEQGVF